MAIKDQTQLLFHRHQNGKCTNECYLIFCSKFDSGRGSKEISWDGIFDLRSTTAGTRNKRYEASMLSNAQQFKQKKSVASKQFLRLTSKKDLHKPPLLVFKAFG